MNPHHPPSAPVGTAVSLALALLIALVSPPSPAGAAPAPLGHSENPAPVADVAAVDVTAIGGTFGSDPTASSARGRDRATAGPWSPPVSPVLVIAPFRAPEARWSPGHRGIDLAAGPGQEVRAVGPGRVAFVGAVAGRGVLSIDHAALRTTYEPVLATVVEGQWVDVGDLVATIATGTGHCGSGGCLHLGLRRGQEYLDPRLLWTSTLSRLRPW